MPNPVVLMYHNFSDSPKDNFTISPDLFKRHLDMLTGEGYPVITSEQLGENLEKRATIPPQSILLTFDDCYESFYTFAYPELLKRNLTATNFVIVGTIGRSFKGIPRLTWPQINEMQSSGISFYPHSWKGHYRISIYPHGNQFSCLSGRILISEQNRWETELEYKQRITLDLKMAKEIMEEKLNKPMTHFAWPYGQSSPVALNIARSLGYKYFYYVSGEKYYNQDDCFSILRINAGNKKISAETLENMINKIFSSRDFQ